MTLVLKPNIQINDHIYPIRRSMLIYDDKLYDTFKTSLDNDIESIKDRNNKDNRYKAFNEDTSIEDSVREQDDNVKGNIFDALYSKICILIDNEPSNIPIWGVNNLYYRMDEYSNEEINFMYFCLLRFTDNLTKINYIDITGITERVIKHYCYYRQFISWEFYSINYPINSKILRFYSTINKFTAFYRRYGSYDLSGSFEFDLSKQELSASRQGTWILRKSSLSRVLNIKDESQREKALENIKKYLIEFYALSWRESSGAFHVRFIFVPWKGWCVLREPDSYDLSVTPPYFKGKWFVCFIDCLEYLVGRHNLNF